MESIQMSPEFVLTVGGAIATSLVGAIAYLYKLNEQTAKTTKDELTLKLNKCEEDHKEKDVKITGLGERVARLEERDGLATQLSRLHDVVIGVIAPKDGNDEP